MLTSPNLFVSPSLNLYSYSIFLPGKSSSPTSISAHKGSVKYHSLPGSLKFLISVLIHFSLLLASIVLHYSFYSKIDSFLHFPTVTLCLWTRVVQATREQKSNVHTSVHHGELSKCHLIFLSSHVCCINQILFKVIASEKYSQWQLKEILGTKMYNKFWDEEKNMAAY